MSFKRFKLVLLSVETMAGSEDIPGTISQEDIDAADKLKNEANEYFKSEFSMYWVQNIQKFNNSELRSTFVGYFLPKLRVGYVFFLICL